MTPKKEAEKVEKAEPPKAPENIAELLGCIQRKLKAPKSQYNKHGGFNYRKCEDILEGLKPLLPAGAYVTVQDSVQMIGDRFYIEATASIHYKGESVSNKAYAREALEQKGMQASQLTGSTSSYARKYALNGLFLIDDTEDSDSDKKVEEKAKGVEVVGGSIRGQIDEGQELEFYNQALASINGADGWESLKKVWSNQWKARATYKPDHWVDIEQAYQERKKEFPEATANGAH